MGHRINKANKIVVIHDNGRTDSLSVIMRKVIAAGGPEGWRVVVYCPPCECQGEQAYDRTAIGFRLPEPSQGVTVIDAPLELVDVEMDDVEGPLAESEAGRSGRRRSGRKT